MNDDALERLETKVAYLEQAHQDLSDVLYKTRLELDSLTARLAALVSRLQDDDGSPAKFDADAERPPHY
jgi:uncharacterized coiled-coil protein SlyX